MPAVQERAESQTKECVGEYYRRRRRCAKAAKSLQRRSNRACLRAYPDEKSRPHPDSVAIGIRARAEAVGIARGDRNKPLSASGLQGNRKGDFRRARKVEEVSHPYICKCC